MTKKVNTAEQEYELYKDPAYQQPLGPGRRRSSRFTELVPVRFTREALDDVRRLAASEDRSVSSWIRRAVERARSRGDVPGHLPPSSELIKDDRLGDLRFVPNADTLQIEDWATALNNLQRLPGLGKRAKDQGFWIEAISVRASFYEFALRLWIAASTSDPSKAIGKQPTLGVLVRKAAALGLNTDLTDIVRRFNEGRNAAVHGLLTGRSTYADLSRVLADDARYGDLLAAVYEKLPPHRLAR